MTLRVMSGSTIIRVKKADDGQRIGRWLKQNAPHIPYSLAQKLFRKGAIKVDGKKAKPADKVREGQEVRIPEVEHRERSTESRAQKKISREDAEKYLLNNIIYEDDRLVAINKPSGLAAQGGTKVKISVDDLLPFLGEGDCKLIHRIDKDTSGIMLLGKGRENTAEIAKRFKAKNVEKIYWAIVIGMPEEREGRIDLPLNTKKTVIASEQRERGDPKTGLLRRSASRNDGNIEKTIIDEKDGKKAVTKYKVVDNASDKLCWVELYPETGRMHQLRVHMDAIGHPVLGDGKYGGKQAFIHGLPNRMHLHARKIILPGYFKGTGVSGQESRDLVIEAELPAHMQKTFRTFEFA